MSQYSGEVATGADAVVSQIIDSTDRIYPGSALAYLANKLTSPGPDGGNLTESLFTLYESPEGRFERRNVPKELRWMFSEMLPTLRKVKAEMNRYSVWANPNLAPGEWFVVVKPYEEDETPGLDRIYCFPLSTHEDPKGRILISRLREEGVLLDENDVQYTLGSEEFRLRNGGKQLRADIYVGMD